MEQEIVKKKMGRPLGSNKPKVELTDDIIKVCENAFAMGYNQETVADLLGVSYRTLKNYIAKDKRLKDVFKTGKLKTNLKVYNKLMQLIEDGNASATIFYCKTQLGWRETNRNELAIANDNPNNANVNPTMLMNNFKQNVLQITVTDENKNMINDKNNEVRLNDSSTVQLPNSNN